MSSLTLAEVSVLSLMLLSSFTWGLDIVMGKSRTRPKRTENNGVYMIFRNNILSVTGSSGTRVPAIDNQAMHCHVRALAC